MEHNREYNLKINNIENDEYQFELIEKGVYTNIIETVIDRGDLEALSRSIKLQIEYFRSIGTLEYDY